MTEKMIPESEAQAMVAAAIERAAHVYLDAIQAELNDLSPTADYEAYTWGEHLFDKLNQLPILADQNALAEHDAALRARQLELQDEIDVFTQKQAELREQLAHLQTGCAEWKGKAKKLKAENAELREALQWSIGYVPDDVKAEDCDSTESFMEFTEKDNKARALLAKSGGATKEKV